MATASARFDVRAGLDATSILNEKYETRVFRFPTFQTVAYDGSDGWHYSDAILTLSRAVDGNQTAFANFDFHFTTQSVGRSTFGHWVIYVELMANNAPIRQLMLGKHLVGRAATTTNLQGNVAASMSPGLNGTPMLPMTVAEFQTIDGVHLFSSGQQGAL